MRNRRKQYWVDRAVQGALVRRIIFHWLVLFALCVMFLPLWRLINGAELNAPFAAQLQQAWAETGPIFLLMLLLLPFFVWDTIKLSNRFVGPMYRIRKTLNSIAAGEVVGPIRFRQTDFWQETAHDFNIVLQRLRMAEGGGEASADEGRCAQSASGAAKQANLEQAVS